MSIPPNLPVCHRLRSRLSAQRAATPAVEQPAASSRKQPFRWSDDEVALGSDRGKDIVASPDGFGFESPRIVVEVKHRQGAIGSQPIRSFLGVRHPQDKGLYVSTGGFSKDALYEAERASIPLSLMTIDDLVEAVIQNYDRLDIETQQLLPLKRIYWPA